MRIKVVLHKAKQTASNKMAWLIAITVLVSLMNAVNAVYYVDFNPINGDFQNYNPVRRLLDGQTPYRDFSVYLGCGQLFLNALGCVIGGNSLRGSMVMMRFLSTVLWWLCMYMVSHAVTQSKKAALLLSSGLVFLNIWHPGNLFDGMDSVLAGGFGLGLAPGNSARLFRAFILIIVLFLSGIFVERLWKRGASEKNRLMAGSAICGAIAGGGYYMVK